MSEGSTSPKRARLDYDDGIKDDHYDKYKVRDHDDQGSYTHPRRKRMEPEEDDLKESDEVKVKNVAMDAARREHTLVMRLTNKEQELQECMNQIQEMKQAQTQNTAQLRSMLLDPAINLVFQRMAREMDEHKEKLKQKQNELSAWKFTPDRSPVIYPKAYPHTPWNSRSVEMKGKEIRQCQRFEPERLPRLTPDMSVLDPDSMCLAVIGDSEWSELSLSMSIGSTRMSTNISSSITRTTSVQTGMRLMAKCRMLLQENGELGKMISSGRTSRLEGEITLQKALVTEMKQNQKELDEFVGELEEDVESMQGMILMLQQQLKEAKEQIGRLQEENQLLRKSQIPAEPGGLSRDTHSPPPRPEVQAARPEVQAARPAPQQHTHQPSLSNSTPKDLPESSYLKDSGNGEEAVSVANAGLSANLRLAASHTSHAGIQRSPDCKVTPDSGMQTQEEDDDMSVDAADFPPAGDLPIQESNNLVASPDRNPVTVKLEPVIPSESHPSAPVPEERISLHTSLKLEVEHNSHELIGSKEVSNTHSHNEIARTLPLEGSGAIRTDSPSNGASEDACSGSVALSDRTSSRTSIPANGDEVKVEVDAGAGIGDARELNRTSACSGGSDKETGAENNVDDDKREKVSKQCGELSGSVPQVMVKVETDCNVDCGFGFQSGLTNGSNDDFDSSDL